MLFVRRRIGFAQAAERDRPAMDEASGKLGRYNLLQWSTGSVSVA